MRRSANVADLQTLDPQFLASLELELSHLKDPAVAMSVILDALDQQHLKENPVTGQDTSRHLLAVRFLFGSHLGTSMLAETMRQIVTMRYTSRNVKILKFTLPPLCSTHKERAPTRNSRI